MRLINFLHCRVHFHDSALFGNNNAVIFTRRIFLSNYMNVTYNIYKDIVPTVKIQHKQLIYCDKVFKMS